MIDDRALRACLVLAEELHFARTAERLGIAQLHREIHVVDAGRPVPEHETGFVDHGNQDAVAFNKLAFVEVGSAAVPSAGIAPAQVLNGRTITASVGFHF